jgi:hypothetical protein
MVSFTALAEARRGHVQSLVAPLTVPILRLLDDGEPDFWCTGFILQVGPEAVLVSAGHALEEEAPTLQFSDGEIARLDNPVVLGKELLPHPDPIDDVACVQLTTDEARRLHLSSTPLSTAAPFEYRSPAGAYIIYGYRGTQQRFDHANPVFYNQASSIMLGPSEGAAALSRFLPEQALLLGTTPPNFRGPRGRGGVPKFRGMSGSPVWRFNPQEEYSVSNLPPLVGVLLGEASNTKKALLILRIGVVLELLESAYPNLVRYLPRFRAAG